MSSLTFIFNLVVVSVAALAFGVLPLIAAINHLSAGRTAVLPPPAPTRRERRASEQASRREIRSRSRSLSRRPLPAPQPVVLAGDAAASVNYTGSSATFATAAQRVEYARLMAARAAMPVLPTRRRGWWKKQSAGPEGTWRTDDQTPVEEQEYRARPSAPLEELSFGRPVGTGLVEAPLGVTIRAAVDTVPLPQDDASRASVVPAPASFPPSYPPPAPVDFFKQFAANWTVMAPADKSLMARVAHAYTVSSTARRYNSPVVEARVVKAPADFLQQFAENCAGTVPADDLPRLVELIARLSDKLSKMSRDAEEAFSYLRAFALDQARRAPAPVDFLQQFANNCAGTVPADDLPRLRDLLARLARANVAARARRATASVPFFQQFADNCAGTVPAEDLPRLVDLWTRLFNKMTQMSRDADDAFAYLRAYAVHQARRVCEAFAEQERLAAEAQAQNARLAEEARIAAEQEQLAAEAQAAALLAEQARIAAEQKREAELAAASEAERARLKEEREAAELDAFQAEAEAIWAKEEANALAEQKRKAEEAAALQAQRAHADTMDDLAQAMGEQHLAAEGNETAAQEQQPLASDQVDVADNVVEALAIARNDIDNLIAEVGGNADEHAEDADESELSDEADSAVSTEAQEQAEDADESELSDEADSAEAEEAENAMSEQSMDSQVSGQSGMVLNVTGFGEENAEENAEDEVVDIFADDNTADALDIHVELNYRFPDRELTEEEAQLAEMLEYANING